jgi:RimJ/RimL family protein N-acetyltransferase
MLKYLLDVPSSFRTERLLLRSYAPGDGPMYLEMARRNRDHLERFDRDSPARSIVTEDDAENLVRGFAAAFEARDTFYLGAFLQDTGAFAAQVRLRVSDWGLPEVDVGFFCDVDHEGNGYVTEAVRGTLAFAFGPLVAHRVRLECSDVNERCRRIAERCAFVREGHIRENRLDLDGQITGTLHFGLLRSEFAGDA